MHYTNETVNYRYFFNEYTKSILLLKKETHENL